MTDDAGKSVLRVIVCGGRDYTQEWNVFQTLEMLWEENDHKLCVIEGGARGADKAASDWAWAWRDNGVWHEQFPANWREHGKSAGPRRNQRMLIEGKPDLVVAFPGGTGTADMVDRARKAGVRVQYGPFEPSRKL